MKKKLFRLAALCLAALLSLGALPARAANVPANQLTVTPIGRQDHAFVDPIKLGDWPRYPDLDADTAILVELNTGTVLYANNIHQRMYPASITKIMTALLTLENADMRDTLTLSYNSVTDLVDGGPDSQGRFYEGQSFSIEEALYALCLDSVNTVGYGLAEYIDGSLEGFADRMNARAKQLGALNTTFRNPHGLNDDDHMTTAYDMAKILWAAAENDTYRKIAGTPTYSFKDGNGITINCSHNYRVFHPDDDLYYDLAVCGKTGYISDAMFTRALYATDGKLDLIAVTFHSDTTWQAYDDIFALMDFGFNNFSLVEIPEFNEKDWFLISEEGKNIRLKAGEPERVARGTLLVPTSLAEKGWTTNLSYDFGRVCAQYCLGDQVMASYPLTLELPEPETTEAPTEAPTKATEPAPTETQAPSTKATTKAGSTAAPTSASAESTEEPGNGKLPAKAVLIMSCLGILLCVCLILILLLAFRNRELKRRNKRRSRGFVDDGKKR